MSQVHFVKAMETFIAHLSSLTPVYSGPTLAQSALPDPDLFDTFMVGGPTDPNGALLTPRPHCKYNGLSLEFFLPAGTVLSPSERTQLRNRLRDVKPLTTNMHVTVIDGATVLSVLDPTSAPLGERE